VIQADSKRLGWDLGEHRQRQEIRAPVGPAVELKKQYDIVHFTTSLPGEPKEIVSLGSDGPGQGETKKV
jgi:hypothetical protein